MVFLIGKIGNLSGWGHFFMDAANGILLFGIHGKRVGDGLLKFEVTAQCPSR